MGVEITGTTELTQDINEMADALRTSGGNGGAACNWILQNAAQPIYEQMLMNVSSNPKVVTGTLRNSIRIGKAIKHRGGGYSVTVGVHRGDGAGYAVPVEYGHGGPHPAPPHPFVRPAFDAHVDEAYEKVKQMLITALEARGLR